MILRKLMATDAELMYEWMNDPAVNQYFRFNKKNLSVKKCRAFIENSFTDNDRHYAIEDAGEYMGTISLKHIDHDNETAEYAIALRKSAQGKHLGTTASKAILEIAFNELKLNKVYLDVLSENIPAIGLYNKLGFKEEGILRQHIKINNEFKDLKLFGLLKEDYGKL